MSIFDDEKPKIAQNSFTAKDAGEVFKKVAKEIEDGNLPAEIADTAIDIAKVLVGILKVVV